MLVKAGVVVVALVAVVMVAVVAVVLLLLLLLLLLCRYRCWCGWSCIDKRGPGRAERVCISMMIMVKIMMMVMSMDTMAVHQADERKKAVPSIGFRSVQLIQSIRKQAACLTFFSAKSGSSCCVAHSLKRGFRFAKGAIVECRDSSLSGICSHSGSHFVKSSRRHPYPFNPKTPHPLPQAS